MNQKLQKILDTIQKTENLSTEEKDLVLKTLKETDKELEITAFKLERTEKVKKTTAILLEETIEELEQKRKAVEAQNRELEIEASLERVRAVAMSMNNSDDLLSICEISFKEFQKLGFNNLRNAIIHILNDEKGFFLDYDFSDTMDGSITTIYYNSHAVVENYLKQIKSAEDAFAEVVIKGDQLNDWKEFRRKSGQLDDPRLESIPALNYYFHSIGVGDIGISTFEPIDDSQINILKRFRNVFDLAYRRYTDITEAEAQAREAQIELGLERVRARAMAMQNSNELSELVDTVFKELTKLDFALSWCIINIIDENSLSNMVWAANPNIDKAPDSYHMKFEDYPFHDAMMKGYKGRETKYIYVLEGIEKKVYDEYLFKETEFRKVPEEAQAASKAMKKYVCSFTFGNFGGLQTVGEEQLSDANLDILSRFGKVFDLTYTRFNDLKQAEAQAREAQIEAALERVRSRTMGMQKSEELKEVIQVVYEQFVHLNIHIEHTGFIMDYKARDDMHIWLADRHEVPSEVTIPYFDCAHWNSFNEAKEKGIDFFANHLTFEEKNRFYQDLFKLIPGVPKETLEYYFSCPGLAISTVLLGNVGLYIENFSGIPYSDEENNTLMRFGKVFQQTYTRFNDLKQAEAQARESQIEVALERVRAKSMAMHKSEELAELSLELVKQVQALGVATWFCAFNIYDEDPIGSLEWGSNGEGTFSKYRTPREGIFLRYYESGQRGETLLINEIGENECPAHYEYLCSLPGVGEQLLKMKDSGISFPTSQIDHVAYFKYGYIIFITFEPAPEAHEIFKRFAKVFEQTYTRFLDLQKAEAQAREAQIEAALERVRSKTMAMHNSHDVGITVVTLFDEVLKLGIDKSIRCGLGILEGKEQMETWSATSYPNGEVDLKMGMLDMTIHPMLIGLKKAWKSGENGYSYQYTGDDVIRYYKALNNEPEYPFHVDLDTLPEKEFHNSFFFSEGILFAFTENLISEEVAKVLNRFASVFGQTYRRYLDLQKAEAQAREAQIEAALEKVRSRSLAMHTSDEMQQVVNAVFEQLQELGLQMHAVGMSGVIKAKSAYEVWVGGSTFNEPLLIPYTDSTQVQREYNHAIENRVEIFSKTYSGDIKKEYIDFLLNKNDFPDKLKKLMLESEAFSTSLAFTKNSGIQIARYNDQPYSDQENEVLKRFAKVFEQAYIRFLDLQKAEGQKREAKVEASLERVRSQAMAMHSSEDLAATVSVFFKELKTLNIIPIRCGVGQIDEATRTTSLVTTTSSQQGKSFDVMGKIKQTGHPVLDGIFENWKLQKEYHPLLQGEEIKKYYSVMNHQINYPDYPDDVIQYGNLFYFKEGFVFAWTEKELSGEDLNIFRKFTSVLSLTYRRYIDLKETEVRAFEAVRQASLDRVRAEIASMRTTEDLQSITPIIWSELKTLNVPFIRCGVFIVDEENAKVQVFLTTPDGLSLGVLNLPINVNELTSNSVEHWRKRKVYMEHWNKNQFINWMKSMIELGQIQNRETYQGSAKPPESLDLHFVPFTQGMLYVGNTTKLKEEKLQLVKSLAEAFSIAYARYEDFQRLETAKVEVESAFGELDVLSKELKVKNEELENENQRKAIELEEARQLQLSMLPKVIPKLPNLEIAVSMETATEVGGDYYDFQVGMDGTLTTVIGDATGHGMKAGTVVTITKSLFNSMAANENILGTFDKISQVIKGMKFRQLAMCLIMMKIRGNRLSISSAAMPPTLIYRAKNKSVEEILLQGMPLGTMKKFPYKKIESHLNRGDRILLYSDGLPELANDKGQMFGYDRIKTEYQSIGEREPAEIVEHLKNSASQWSNGKEPDDDVTFVVIKVK